MKKNDDINSWVDELLKDEETSKETEIPSTIDLKENEPEGVPNSNEIKIDETTDLKQEEPEVPSQEELAELVQEVVEEPTVLAEESIEDAAIVSDEKGRSQESKSNSKGKETDKPKRDNAKKEKQAESKQDSKDDKIKPEAAVNQKIRTQDNESLKQESDSDNVYDFISDLVGGKSDVTEPKNVGKPVKKRSKKPLLFGLIIVIAAGLFLGWTLLFNTKSVDLSDSLQISVKGTNGLARVEAAFDSEKVPEAYRQLVMNIDLEITPKVGLSNGDTALITMIPNENGLAYLEHNKLKLSPTEIKVNIEDLSDGLELDIFEITTPVFTGAEGKGVAEYSLMNIQHENAAVQSILRNIKSETVPNTDLSNGDKVKVSIKPSQDDLVALQEQGVILMVLSHEYEVSGLTLAPTSASQIKNEPALRAQVLKKIEADYGKHTQLYMSFRVTNVCYSIEPKNNVNATDYYEGHGYSGISLMYIIEFDRVNAAGHTTLADNYGFTDLKFDAQNNALLDGIKTMSPYQDNGVSEVIRQELVSNGFSCE